MSIQKISIADKLGLFKDHWKPRVIGELNGQHVKVAKALGEFDWHKHDHEDEMFLVIKGEFNMELRDKTLVVRAGEMIIIPKGVEHRPVANDEVEFMLFEPASTLNTGDQPHSDLTQNNLGWI